LLSGRAGGDYHWHMTSLVSKRERLQAELKTYERVVVAFSGGVDSTFVAAMAQEALGRQARAITGVSPSVAPAELAEAKELARRIGIAHSTVETYEMDNPDYVANSEMRCFHCKDELYGILTAIGEAAGGAVVVDGTNADDAGDWRPGRKAATRHGVRSPLLELGFTKDDIRALSKEMGLPTWDKPAMACLASRIPHGTPVTVEALDAVGAAEAMLRTLGIRQVRVRHHGDVARIETDEAGMEIAFSAANRGKVVSRLQSLGFKHVALDLAGYRTGSMNVAREERGETQEESVLSPGRQLEG
jgi:pyridinium-3,5-biscarboxylic acid mononucleotide sulfurtransferase